MPDGWLCGEMIVRHRPKHQAADRGPQKARATARRRAGNKQARASRKANRR